MEKKINKAIIFAAGKGTRLQKILNGEPKPLLKINRKSLIEILVDNLKSLKIKNIVILTGFNSKRIKDKIKKNVQSTLIIPITKKQIIYTLCFILKELNQSSLCLFSDVIFDKKILVNLIKSKQDIVLAVDKKVDLKIR